MGKVKIAVLRSSLTWNLQNQHFAIKPPHPHCFLSEIAIVSCRNRTFSTQSTYCFRKLYQLKKAVSAHSFSWAMLVWTLLRPHILVKGLNWLKGSLAQSQSPSKNTERVSADSDAEQAHQAQKCLIHTVLPLHPLVNSLPWVFDSLSCIKLLFCSPLYSVVVFSSTNLLILGRGGRSNLFFCKSQKWPFLCCCLGCSDCSVPSACSFSSCPEMVPFNERRSAELFG